MTKESFIEFHKKLGHQILISENAYWMLRDDKSAISLPTLFEVNPKVHEIKKMLSYVKVLTFKSKNICGNSKEYLFSGNNYELDKFSSKTRNQIRKGLKSCIVAIPNAEDIKLRGLQINKCVLQKQNRYVSYLCDNEKWNKYIENMSNNPDVNVSGAYYNNILIAYSIFIKVENKYIIYHPFMDYEYSSMCPMNAILYTFINNVIQREGTCEISYGFSSIKDIEGLDKFKHGMLFKDVIVTRITVFRGIYFLIINSFTIRVFKMLKKIHLISVKTLNVLNYIYDSKISYKKYLTCLK